MGRDSQLHFELIGKVIGARVAQGAPRISHLLFADDIHIFGEVTTLGASNLLEVYANCLGQLVTFAKSSMFLVQMWIIITERMWVAF